MKYGTGKRKEDERKKEKYFSIALLYLLVPPPPPRRHSREPREAGEERSFYLETNGGLEETQAFSITSIRVRELR